MYIFFSPLARSLYILFPRRRPCEGFMLTRPFNLVTGLCRTLAPPARPPAHYRIYLPRPPAPHPRPLAILYTKRVGIHRPTRTCNTYNIGPVSFLVRPVFTYAVMNYLTESFNTRAFRCARAYNDVCTCTRTLCIVCTCRHWIRPRTLLCCRQTFRRGHVYTRRDCRDGPFGKLLPNMNKQCITRYADEIIKKS